MSPAPVMSSDDILRHLDQVHQTLPAPVKDALDHAHTLGGGQPATNLASALKPQEPATSAVAPPPVDSGVGSSAPGMIGADKSDLSPEMPLPPMRAPSDSASLLSPPEATGSTVAPPPVVPTTGTQKIAPVPSEAQQFLSNVTAAPLPSDNPLSHTRFDTGLAGAQQVKNPFLRTLSTIGDVIGSGLFPGFAQFIPGTSAHHFDVVQGARNRVADEQGEQKARDEAANAEALRERESAQAKESNAHAESIANPPNPKEWAQLTEPIIDPKNPDAGPQIAYVNKNDPTQIEFLGKAAAKPTEDKATASVHVLPDGSVVSINHDPKTGKSTAEVVYKGDPKEAPPKIVQLQKNGKPHQVLVKDDGTEIKDLGESGEKPATVNVNEGQRRADSSYDKREAELNTIGKPIEDIMQRFGKLQDTLDQGTPQADALVAPELLTVMAGGMGSGLRMNEAEISRIVGGRSKWETLKAAVNKWRLDPSKANSITSEQRQEIRSLVSGVAAKLYRKQDILSRARSALAASDDPTEHRRVVNDAREKLNAIDSPDAESEAKGSSIPTVTSQAEFDKLPKGAEYIEDGKRYRKP